MMHYRLLIYNGVSNSFVKHNNSMHIKVLNLKFARELHQLLGSLYYQNSLYNYYNFKNLKSSYNKFIIIISF